MTDEKIDSDAYRRIDDEAAAWAARRLSGAFNDGDARRFNAWRAADPRHEHVLQEYLDIAEISALAGIAGGQRAPANDERFDGARKTRRWLIAAPAIAASLFAAVVIAPRLAPAPVETQQFATLLGETRELTLSDGTTVVLNTESEISIVMEEGRRSAVLKKGEAFFDVAHDPSRPFTVSASDVEATVLGTSFSIRAKEDESVICVHSGVVAVRPTSPSTSAQTTRLTAGEHVAVAATGDIGPVVNFDPMAAATWRNGYLRFEQTPLREVVADINRYYKTQIRLEDASLGDAPVTGRFDLSDHDVIIRALSVALSLDVEQRGSSEIYFMANE